MPNILKMWMLEALPEGSCLLLSFVVSYPKHLNISDCREEAGRALVRNACCSLPNYKLSYTTRIKYLSLLLSGAEIWHLFIHKDR